MLARGEITLLGLLGLLGLLRVLKVKVTLLSIRLAELRILAIELLVQKIMGDHGMLELLELRGGL